MKAWSEEFEDYTFENINDYPIKRTSNIVGKTRTFIRIVCDFYVSGILYNRTMDPCVKTSPLPVWNTNRSIH